ncbi:MAG TPA: Crp/Fnr family transcriptional regulator [Verrucomicrobiae bacterium]|nr:Crp/Fnr family transcriptional regulator [Verrucomicrobiae bacterium]
MGKLQTVLGEAFQPFLKTLITKRFRQGNILIYQGEVPRNAYIVKSGIVKLYNITPQGDERIATFKLQGDIFPTTWSFDKGPTAFYYYEAQTDGEMYVVPTEEFRDYINKNHEALQAVANHYLGNYAGALMRITALEQPKAADKVLYTLYYLMQVYGREMLKGSYRIEMQLTQQMIADLIGLTRETTAAELVKLKKKGILRYRGREYTINRDKLILSLGEDNFKDLQI